MVLKKRQSNMKQSSLSRLLKRNRKEKKQKERHPTISNTIGDNGVKNCNRTYWMKNEKEETKKYMGKGPNNENDVGSSGLRIIKKGGGGEN